MSPIILVSIFIAIVLPILIIFLLPKKVNFFEKNSVRAFALGIYLALIFILLRESFEHVGYFISIITLVIFVFISYLLGVFIKGFHHHHGSTGLNHKHGKVETTKILVSDFLHNIIDGVSIASGFMISNTFGFVALFGVLGHQIIQQTGQYLLLVQEGFKPMKSIMFSFLISLSIFIGVFINAENEMLLGIIMASSAGIIFFKIINDTKEFFGTQGSKKSSVWFIVGILLMLISLFIFPHGH